MSSEPPADAWDEVFAQSLVGRLMLVGMTYVRPDDTLIRREQFFGTVVSVDQRFGIKLELEGTRTGEEHVLPPHTANIHPAKRGEYRLRSTGEVVEDPDFLSNWTIRKRGDA